MSESCWFPVFTAPLAESLVVAGIVAANFAFFYPQNRFRDKQRGYVSTPLIPRFLFVNCVPNRLNELRMIHGVQSVWHAIPASDLDELRCALDIGTFDRTRHPRRGDAARLKDGPLRDLVFRVISADATRREKLLTGYIGQFRARVLADKLEKIDPEKLAA
jgi:hypothetical protein